MNSETYQQNQREIIKAVKDIERGIEHMSTQTQNSINMIQISINTITIVDGKDFVNFETQIENLKRVRIELLKIADDISVSARRSAENVEGVDI